MRLVVLGAPGAGKGTQAKSLAAYYNMAHISTGDIFREHVIRKTELGVQIHDIMEKGSLVPDDITIELVREEINGRENKNGYILDGFPRTLPQAQALKELAEGHPDGVIYVAVDDAVIIERMSGRVVCGKCGEMYHLVYYPPAVSSVCDKCGGTLMQRNDDEEHTVIQRLEIYHKMTAPIIGYYENEGILIKVSGVGDAGEITKNIIKQLDHVQSGEII